MRLDNLKCLHGNLIKKKKGNKSRNHEISRNNLTKGHRFRSLPKSTRQFWPIVESRSEINEVTLTLFYKSQSIPRKKKKKKGERKRKIHFAKILLSIPAWRLSWRIRVKKKEQKRFALTRFLRVINFLRIRILSLLLSSFLPIPFIIPVEKKRTKRFSTSVNFNYRCNRRFFLFSFFLEKFFPEFSRAYIRRNTYIGGVSRRIKKG